MDLIEIYESISGKGELQNINKPLLSDWNIKIFCVNDNKKGGRTYLFNQPSRIDPVSKTISINTRDVLNYIYDNHDKYPAFGTLGFIDSTESQNRGFYDRRNNIIVRSYINYIDSGLLLNKFLNKSKINDIKNYLEYRIEENDETFNLEKLLKIMSDWFYENNDWKSIIKNNLYAEERSLKIAQSFFKRKGWRIIPTTQREDFEDGIDFKIRKNDSEQKIQVKAFITRLDTEYYAKKGIDYILAVSLKEHKMLFYNLKNGKQFTRHF